MAISKTKFTKSLSRSRSQRALSFGFVALLLLLLLLHATPARAFCRTTSCDRANEVCSTDAHGCVVKGTPLFWPVGTLDLAVDSRGSQLRKISKADFEAAVTDALSAWEQAACKGGGHPALHASSTTIDGAVVGFDAKGPNDNVVILEDEGWSYGATVIGKTMMKFGQENGEIFDADIALNSGGYPFALSPGPEEADLVGVLTHEIGHVLGLDHSDVLGATMQPETQGFATPELRTLEPDDVKGICAIYPHESASNPATDPQAPMGGASGSCSIVHSTHSAPRGAACALLFVLCFRRRLPRRCDRERGTKS